MKLSIEHLRRWCLAHTKRGKSSQIKSRDAEFSSNAFLRTVGWTSTDFYKWLHGKEVMPRRVQQTMSRFVAEWEAGRIAFTPYKTATKRELVRLERPRPRTTMTVRFGAGTPTLSFVPRPVTDGFMPSFSELIRPRLTK